MKIQVLSDLHIEGANMSAIPPVGDVLVLAGDVAAYPEMLEEFFYTKVPQEIPVIFVPGNHEHEYQHILKAADMYKQMLKDLPNVTVLQNESVVIDDVVFLGSTLWSNFQAEGMHRREALMDWASIISDFKRIKSDHDYLMPSEMEALSEKSRQYLVSEIERFQGRKIVVVTHFAPSLRSRSPRFEDDSGYGYWVNDMPDLFGKSSLHIHGHVHDSMDYVENGTRVICNPRGHSKQYNLSTNAKFDPCFCVEI